MTARRFGWAAWGGAACLPIAACATPETSPSPGLTATPPPRAVDIDKLDLAEIKARCAGLWLHSLETTGFAVVDGNVPTATDVGRWKATPSVQSARARYEAAASSLKPAAYEALIERHKAICYVWQVTTAGLEPPKASDE